MTDINRIFSFEACQNTRFFTGPPGVRLLSHHDRAAEASENLSQVGYDVVVQAPRPTYDKLIVSWEGVALGNVNVWSSGKTSFNEIRVPAFARAIEQACAGRMQNAAMLTTVAANTLSTDGLDFHIFVASSGSPSLSTFGAVLVEHGMDGRHVAGEVAGPALLAEIEGTVQILQALARVEADRVAVYAQANVGKYATGQMKAREDKLAASVSRLVAAVESGPELVWMPRDTSSYGHLCAKRYADDQFAEAQSAF